MPTYGGYETVRELYSGVRGSLYSARMAGTQEAPSFAVKTFTPAYGGGGWARGETELFLESARIQKRLAETEPNFWAPILEFGAEGEAFYVTKLYARSAQDLVGGRVRLSSWQLARIVGAVIAGLRHIQQASKRPNGNVKPSNVLFGGGDLETCEIVLSDPLPDRRLGADRSEAVDLKALGGLIGALVLHRAGVGEEEVANSSPAAWKGLGKDSAAWRELCLRLLRATAAEPGTTLEAAAGEAERLGRKRKQAWPWVAGGSAAAAAAAIAVILILRMEPPPEPVAPGDPTWRRLCLEHESWFRNLRRSENLRQLGGVAGELQTLRSLPAEKKSDDPLNPYRMGAGEGLTRIDELAGLQLDTRLIQKATGALKTIDAVRAELKGWEARGALQELLVVAEQNKLGDASKHLEELLEQSAPPEREPLEEAANIPERLVGEAASELAKPDVAEIAALIWAHREAVKALPGQFQLVAGSGDAVAARFTEFVLKEAGGEATAQQFLQKLSDRHPLGEKLAKAVQDRWPKVDQAYFKKHADVYGETVMGEGTFARWIERVAMNDFGLLAAKDDPRSGWNGPEELTMARREASEVEALNSKDPDPKIAADLASANQKLNEFEARIAELSGFEWNRENKDVIQSRSAELRNSMASVGLSLEHMKGELIGGCEEYIASAKREGRISPSDAVNAFWVRVRDERIAGASTCQNARSQIRPIREKLVKFEEELPRGLAAAKAPTTYDAEKGNAAAAKKRESIIAAALSAEGAAEGDLTNQASIAREEFERWQRDAARVVESFAAVEDRLQETLGFDLKGDKTVLALYAEAKGEPFSELAESLELVNRRLKAMEDIRAGHDSATLRQHLLQGDVPTRVAAWIQLGAVESWPQGLDDLQRETEMWAELRGEMEKAAGGGERRRAVAQTIGNELAREAPKRWNRFCRGLDFKKLDRRTVNAAGAALDKLGEHKGDAEPSLRYDLLLCDLTLAIGTEPGLEDAQLKAVLAGFDDRVRQLGDRIGGVDEVKRLLAGLDAEIKDERPVLDFKLLGPARTSTAGAAGWKFERANGEENVTYAWTSGSGRKHELTFARVEAQNSASGSTSSSYLCTTEMPVGMVIDWVDERGDWARFYESMNSPNPETGGWKGPRCWTWRYPEDLKRGFTTNAHWLWDDMLWPAGQQYPEALRVQGGDRMSLNPAFGGDPTPSHPIQGIPLQATLYLAWSLECRLPTPDEWRAAWKSQSETGAKPNLRDLTWKMQHDYVKECRGQERGRALNNWPDDRAFPEEGEGAQIAVNADDRTLWFDRVKTQGDEREGNTSFFHLVGNVAEFVCEDVQLVTDLKLDEGDPFKLINNRFKGKWDKLGVIGGSALTSKDVSVDAVDKMRTIKTSTGLPPSSGYSDVGMRLAFSAGPAQRPLLTRVRSLLEKEDWYLAAQ
ncbi:MAG: hypothetical protein L0Y42_03010 [Phycisphaerales bacterium]|nr:hypothetical protein [Phycisphaerales bacterium]